MTRLMADSTNLDDIAAGAFPLIGYYGDGDFAATPAQIQRHVAAGSRMAAITVGRNPTTEPIADCETGDYLPWETVDFCIAKRGQGIDPSVYVSYDLWPATQTEFRLRGVLEPHWWVALWDGNMALIPGSVASQRRNPPLTGGHYDESVVADFWPGIDPTFGPGGGTLTGGQEVMVADVVAAFQYGMPPKALWGMTYAQMQNIIATQSWDQITSSLGGDARDYLQKIQTPLPIGTLPPVSGGGGGGGTEPPEPAEPTSATLHVPAQDIPISFP